MNLQVRRTVFEPIWHQVNRSLKEKIRTGEPGFRPGEKLPTEKALAGLCGINRLTMRKALAPLADDGLIIRKQGKGTFVRPRCPGSEQQELNIAFLAARDGFLSAFFVTYQILGARRAGVRLGKRFRNVVASVKGEEFLESFCRGLDGLIVVGDCVDKGPLTELKTTGLPCVVTMTDRTELGLSSVVFDEEEAAYLQTRHLIQLGHSRIAFINSLPILIRQRERADGYRRAMDEANLTVAESCMVEVEQSGDAAQEAAAGFLRMPSPPTGVVIASDYVAHGFMQGLQAHSIAVPDEVSVVGCGDGHILEKEYGNNGHVPLTSFSFSYERMGATAAAELIKRIATPGLAARCIRLKGKLVVRASSGPPPA